MPSIVSAHGVVEDTTGEVSSILHYVPEDDPVVGIATVFHYEFEKSFDVKGAIAELVIKHNNGSEVVVIPAAVGTHTAAASYTFTRAGNYDIILNITTVDLQAYSFKTSEDINLAPAEIKASEAHEMLLIGCMLGLVAVTVLGLIFHYKKRTRS